MSQVQPLASQTLVRSEIQRASAKTAVDFDYLLGQARLESDLDPTARASNSSARGLFQFLSNTWLNTMQKHGAKHGLEWAAAQIEQTGKGPVVRDPAMREQILALRNDPQVASLMAGEFAGDNRETLRSSIGREPNSTDLYLAHFLGPAGATSFLRSLQVDPATSAASLFPKAAASNHNIFFEKSGDERSLGEVYGLLQNKLDDAIGRDRGLGAPTGDYPGTFEQLWSQTASSPSFQQTSLSTHSTDKVTRPSMTETLRASFALDSGAGLAGQAGANVRKAYGILQAFNL